MRLAVLRVSLVRTLILTNIGDQYCPYGLLWSYKQHFIITFLGYSQLSCPVVERGLSSPSGLSVWSYFASYGRS